jgi:hypothetical protein
MQFHEDEMLPSIYPINFLPDINPAFTVSLVGVYCIVKRGYGLDYFGSLLLTFVESRLLLK